jgi:uncharacterized protein YyaL (SSP411 family)
MANRLSSAKSLYLRQHAENPVDWYPWGEEAFRTARERNCPIFLSVGYSACHWCHVMERESFSDPQVAAFLNRHFVCIKVDREEHPEVDAQYMDAVFALTGHGGWPLNVFLTPELKPFYGGTYFPPVPRGGMPAFLQIVQGVLHAWEHRREEVLVLAETLTTALARAAGALGAGRRKLDSKVLGRAEEELVGRFDTEWGGFGEGPKFPHPSVLRFLLMRAAATSSPISLQMATKTLDGMAQGGIHDHLGGGFHRYSTDAWWLVPHFEKMLYDNALLARAYLDAYRYTQKPFYARVARSTLDYILRDLGRPGGGFCSSEDADSEGEEGKFYVWTLREVKEVLGPRAELFAQVFDIREHGPSQGYNIPNLIRSYDRLSSLAEKDREALERELEGCRAELFAVRSKRVRPARDEKIVLSWNAFAVEAFFWAGWVLGESRYLAAAETTLQFLVENLWPGRGQLYHCWNDGEPMFPALADDVAGLGLALLCGFEATANSEYLDGAYRLAEVLLKDFYDRNTGAFFTTGSNQREVLYRRIDYLDNPTPSGTSLAAELLARLGFLLGESAFLARVEEALAALSGVVQKDPIAGGHALVVLQCQEVPYSSWVMALPPDMNSSSPPMGRAAELFSRFFRSFIPGAILAVSGPDTLQFPQQTIASRIFAGRPPLEGQPTLYLCRGTACEPPAVGIEAIARAIAAAAKTSQDLQSQ